MIAAEIEPGDIKPFECFCAQQVPSDFLANDVVERSSFTDAVSRSIAENEIKDVGGIIPVREETPRSDRRPPGEDR